MGEISILEKLTKELKLDEWWLELLGHGPNPDHQHFDLEIAFGKIPRTELTASKEIRRKFDGYLTYSEMHHMWYIWDERIHTPCDGDGLATKVVKLLWEAINDALQFIKQVYEFQASVIKSGGGQDADTKAQKKLEEYNKGEAAKFKYFRDRLATDAGISATVRTLKTECDVPSSYYDNDQRYFVMRNAVIDTEEWTHLINTVGTSNLPVHPHSPTRPVTKYFDADYAAGVNLGHWDNFLRTSVPDKDMREYLQIVCGAAFMGESKLRAIINLVGPPGSGKSVFIGTLFKLGKAGAGYSCMPDSKALSKVKGQNFEQDSFRGRRFIAISEPSHTDPVDDDFIKKYTGDDWVETRTLNVKSSGWVPQGVPFVASNKEIRINTRDQAIVDRVQIIKFPNSFSAAPTDPSRKQIAGLEDMLMQDSASILNWIMSGMVKFILAGKKLNPPKSVTDLRKAVVTNGSAALRWLDDFVEVELLTIEDYTPVQDPYYISLDEAWSRFQMWKIENGERSKLTKALFGEDLKRKFGEYVLDGTTKRIRGVLKTPSYQYKYEVSSLLSNNS